MEREYQIWIPSRGRVSNSGTHCTASYIPDELNEITYLFVPPTEKHSTKFNVIHEPEPMKIRAKRQWIMDNAATDVVIMLDDNMSLSKVVSDGSKYGKRRNLKNSADCIKVYDELFSIINDGFLVAGILHGGRCRFLPDNEINGRQVNNKIHAAWAINKKKVNELGIKFRLTLMSDYDVMLQILRRGHKIANTTKYMFEKKGRNISGGCTDYRTVELLASCAMELQALHGKYVNLTYRNDKSWGMEKRVDVRVRWKKAYTDGITKRKALDSGGA